jgi:general stress protein YciG
MATLSQKRAEAGRRGGIATREKYGKDHFRKIGKLGGDSMHATYAMVPVSQNDFALVHREKRTVKAVISGIPFGRFTKP